jgi:hypothetical protein
MRVLFLARSDYANAGYLFAKSLNTIDVPALCLKRKNNPRRSPTEQGIVIKNDAHIISLTTPATVLVWMHSHRIAMPEIQGKKIHIVFHGGNRYRRAPGIINSNFNRYTSASLVQTDLGLGAKNEHLILPCVDTNFIQPTSYDIGDKLTIAHYPSDPRKKRSVKIFEVMEGLKNDPETKNKFTYHKGSLRPWRRNLSRVDHCDVYIDSLALGAWGFAVLEAAAMGKIVVGGFKDYKRYKCEYGESPLVPVIEEDQADLYHVMKTLILKPKKELVALKKAHRTWAVNYHGLEYTGKRLKRIFDACL